MCFQLKTRRFWRTQLPHWEVEEGYYFITIRCAGSLPQFVSLRIQEIQEGLQAIESSDADFQRLQRRYFQTVEKYSDSNQGFCPFRVDSCACEIIGSLESLKQLGWLVEHYVIMPNHVHFVAKVDATSKDMQAVISRWKGSTSRRANEILRRSGAFWQRDWFDRVIRSKLELDRTVNYIRQNPVKAKLCRNWEEYAYFH